MRALNTLCCHLAPDARVQVSRLGEEILSALIWLWSSKPADELKV